MTLIADIGNENMNIYTKNQKEKKMSEIKINIRENGILIGEFTAQNGLKMDMSTDNGYLTFEYKEWKETE